MTQKWYKVLKDGKSCHGGTHDWFVTADGYRTDGICSAPWQTVAGRPELCRHGFHLTTTPAAWFAPGCQVYEVEVAADSLTQPSPPLPKLPDMEFLLRELAEGPVEEKLVDWERLRLAMNVMVVNKIAVTKCRLVRRLGADELESLHIYTDGEHRLPPEAVVVYVGGRASVEVTNLVRIHAAGMRCSIDSGAAIFRGGIRKADETYRAYYLPADVAMY